MIQFAHFHIRILKIKPPLPAGEYEQADTGNRDIVLPQKQSTWQSKNSDQRHPASAST